MGGNEGELDAAIFLFRWRRWGDRGGGTRPAGGDAVLLFGAVGRRRWLVGRDGGLGRKVGWAES
jgi:hypothetical protein